LADGRAIALLSTFCPYKSTPDPVITVL